MPVTLAIISDLHCQSQDSEEKETFLYYDADPTPRNKHPVGSLIRLIQEEGITADVLLVPGDLTNQMGTMGLLGAWGYALQVSRELQTGLVAATVGNHDVDSRRQLGDDPFRFPREMVEPDFPVPDEVRRQYYWQNGFCMVDHGNLQVLVLNSAADHDQQEEIERGGVTDARLEQIADYLHNSHRTNFRVALAHHHPILHEGCGLGPEDVMRNGSFLLDLLGDQGFDLMIHGHKHHPRLIYGPGGQNSVAVLAAGSLAANNVRNLGLNTFTRNMFHIITLDEPVDRCDHCGTVKSWEFAMGEGWQASKRQSARMPNQTGFGCRVRIDELAEEAVEVLARSGERFLEWNRMLADMPHLAYLIPLDLIALGSRLRPASDTAFSQAA